MRSIAAVAESVAAALDALPSPVGGLGGELAEQYLTLHALAERLEVVSLRWLAALDATGEAAVDGSASTAAWVRRRTGCSGRAAAADVTLARRLHTDVVRPMATTAELLAEGRVSVDHARAIARATAALTPAACATTEPLIAKAAVDLPVTATAQLAAQVGEHAEALHAEGDDDPVAARRAAAEAGRRLHLSRCGELWALDALLTEQAGAALAAVLAPLAMPSAGPDGPDQRSAAQRRADAMGEAAGMLLSSDQLPVHGGHRPQLTVLVDLDQLVAGGGGWLSDGTSVDRPTVERIGCDARVGWLATRTVSDHEGAYSDVDRRLLRAALSRISPALGGLPTQVLDAGRAQRLVSPGQRHALAVRDRGCVFPGCDRPPPWCDAHHLTYWSAGGTSDLDNLVLLCGRHHAVVHDQCWTLTRSPDGAVTAHPPPP